MSEYPICIFPKKWSASRRSLSRRLRYAPHTSQTCSFWWPEGPEVSWRFFNSRSHASFWCLAVRVLCSSLSARATEPVSPRTETSSNPVLIVLERSEICLSYGKRNVSQKQCLFHGFEQRKLTRLFVWRISSGVFSNRRWADSILRSQSSIYLCISRI